MPHAASASRRGAEIEKPVLICGFSEDRRRRPYDVKALIAFFEIDPQPGRQRTGDPDPDAVIVFRVVKAEVAGARGALAGVVEEGGVDVAVAHPPPLGLNLHAVAIAEAPA